MQGELRSWIYENKVETEGWIAAYQFYYYLITLNLQPFKNLE